MILRGTRSPSFVDTALERDFKPQLEPDQELPMEKFARAPPLPFRIAMTTAVALPLVSNGAHNVAPGVLPARTVPAPARVPRPRLVTGLPRVFSSQNRVWCPPQSSTRIEYPREILNFLRPRKDGEYAAGVLYGTRVGHVVCVASARPMAGLEPVGIYAARWRGEVFLTEEDLLHLETLDAESGFAAGIALVIAGRQGGFFVRELDGSMQTIKSYQEFPIRPPSEENSESAKRATPVNRAGQRTCTMGQVKPAKQLNPRMAVAIAVVAGILTGCALLPRTAPPFTVQDKEGQLRIVFSATAHNPGARLRIVDGDERRSIPISPSLTSVVYAPLTPDVHISIVH